MMKKRKSLTFLESLTFLDCLTSAIAAKPIDGPIPTIRSNATWLSQHKFQQLGHTTTDWLSFARRARSAAAA